MPLMDTPRIAKLPPAPVLLAAPRTSAAGPADTMVAVAVAATVLIAVGVEVAFEFDEVGELLEPHPAIKAIGSDAVKIKQPAISFFTIASPEFFLEFQIES